MSHKLHNPKSHAPAVYIPCWLIQVSIKLISHGAKMVYGRLSQWASSNGTAYRSIAQLAQELGCSERSIEEYIKELKIVVLIGTYHPQAGGVNHYEFYDHPWMHEPINDHLVYKQDKYTPPHQGVAPSTPECATPPHQGVDINNKEIKEIKCVGADASHPHFRTSKKEKAELEALSDPEIKTLFENKFSDREITIEELFRACQEKQESKGGWATRSKWKKWVIDEHEDNYKKKTPTITKQKTPDGIDFKRYGEGVAGFEWVGVWIKQQFQNDKLPNDCFQEHAARRGGYEWVGDWLKDKEDKAKQN